MLYKFACLLDLVLEGLDEGGSPHGLCLDDVVVQQQLNVIHGRQNLGSRVTVRDDRELNLQHTQHTVMVGVD